MAPTGRLMGDISLSKPRPAAEKLAEVQDGAGHATSVEETDDAGPAHALLRY